jgi:hypothetical protein
MRAQKKASAALWAAEAGFCPTSLVAIGYLATAALAGLKESAKAWAFGVPTPVTLSQPTFVCREVAALQGVPSKPTLGDTKVQSLPKETTSAVSW